MPIKSHAVSVINALASPKNQNETLGKYDWNSFTGACVPGSGQLTSLVTVAGHSTARVNVKKHQKLIRL